MFNLSDAVKAVRKAYDEGTLQMFLPTDRLPQKNGAGNGCKYAHIVDGVVYHCAVGAMFTDKDEQFKEDKVLNELTPADDLFEFFKIDTNLEGYDNEVVAEFISDCRTLQFHHDEVVVNKRDNASEESMTILNANFLRKLVSMEERYV